MGAQADNGVVGELTARLTAHLTDLRAEGLRLEQRLVALRGQVYEVMQILNLLGSALDPEPPLPGSATEANAGAEELIHADTRSYARSE